MQQMTSDAVAQEIATYLESLTKKTPKRERVGVDRAVVSFLKDQIKSATDPIARLEAAKELRAASEPKAVEPAPHPGLAVFVANGKAWADENDYTAEDLRRYAKVPADVLREAGFAVPRQSERQGSRTRAPRLDAFTNVLPIAAKLDEFKLSDLAAKLERDRATTRNYVNQLVKAGKLAIVGEDGSGTGRPAKVYKVTR
jgi:hypothetical protein